MISGDVEIPGRGVLLSPKVLFTRDADTWDVKLVVCCAVKGTNLADQRLFNGFTDPVQRVQGDSGSDKGSGGNESIQDDDDYAGLDSGGEMLRGRKQGARSMGLGRSGSVTRGYRQASNKRAKIMTRTKNSRLVN